MQTIDVAGPYTTHASTRVYVQALPSQLFRAPDQNQPLLSADKHCWELCGMCMADLSRTYDDCILKFPMHFSRQRRRRWVARSSRSCRSSRRRRWRRRLPVGCACGTEPRSGTLPFVCVRVRMRVPASLWDASAASLVIAIHLGGEDGRVYGQAHGVKPVVHVDGGASDGLRHRGRQEGRRVSHL
jgi:hypothetical protein